ncbi:MAG TPA: Fe-Mn family superoxide dismutase [Burkholderiales bacterium]|nr:Fe-Mn family superoxide dismutase [Burkholderiales bacterium]
MPYTVKSLPCDPSRLDGLSEKLVVGHYVGIYCNTVKRLNVITEQLARLDYARTPSFMLNGLKQEEMAALNSMVLHEIYFESLGGGSFPSDDLVEALTRHFGSFERWHVQFAGLARSQATRSGWAVLAWSSRNRQLLNLCGSDTAVSLAGAAPILALDMHEHAFHLDFGFKASAYVEAFLKNVNWKAVAARYRAASAATEAEAPAEPLLPSDATQAVALPTSRR